MQKINNIRSEIINLDYLYEKLAFSLTQIEEKNDTNSNININNTFFIRSPH